MSYAEFEMPVNGQTGKSIYTETVSNDSLLTKVSNFFSEMYAGYTRNFDQIGPEVWGLMQ
jgi:hypothetical protein